MCVERLTVPLENQLHTPSKRLSPLHRDQIQNTVSPYQTGPRYQQITQLLMSMIFPPFFPILIISPHVWANPYVSTFILRVSKLLWTTQCTRYQRWTVSRAVWSSLGGPELVMSTPNGSCAWVPWGYQLGLSENRVYSQWNSHLIGIMISKTIGFRGTNHFQTHPVKYRGITGEQPP